MRIRKVVTVFIHLVAWLTIAYIFNQIFRIQLRTFHIRNGHQIENVEIHTFPALIFIVLIFKAVFFYANAIPELNRCLRARKWLTYGAYIGLISLILCVTEGLAIGALRNRPHISAFIWLDVLLYIITFGISLAYFLLLEFDRAEKLSLLIAEEQLKTELNFLKAQINPHFFLNTLNNLYSMAQAGDISELEGGILQLSEMMRYILYECQADTVSLDREVEYIRGYIGLTLMRYRRDGSITVNLKADDEGLAGFMIAPLIMIPFVENAFKHGISLEKTSVIDIHISVKDGGLFFMVKNFDHSQPAGNFNHKGIGIANVKRRLEMLYAGKYELDVKNEHDMYTIKLKLTGDEVHHY